jgi:hypothetical protein
VPGTVGHSGRNQILPFGKGDKMCTGKYKVERIVPAKRHNKMPQGSEEEEIPGSAGVCGGYR